MIQKMQQLCSRVCLLFRGIKNYFSIYVIQGKLLFLAVLVFGWLFLFVGALISPDRQQYTKQELAAEKSFDNGSGEIKLLSQVYSKRNHLMVLKFETADKTSSVDLGISAKNLVWKLYAKEKEAQEVMEVVPIIDNKITVVIHHVPEKFEALAVSITNKSVNTLGLQTEFSTSVESSSTTATSSSEAVGNEVQFIVTPKNKKLKKQRIKKFNRSAFLKQEFQQEIRRQQGQMNVLKQTIRELTKANQENQEKITRLRESQEYLVGEDRSATDSDIQTIQNTIRTNEESIERATKEIETGKHQVTLIRKKISDVEKGKLNFGVKIKTVKMQ